MRFWTLASTLTALISGSNLVLANDTVWIDVASQQDYALEHLVDAVHVPHTHIARTVSTHFPDKSTPIKLYDRNQHQAVQAQEALQTLGYEQVINSGDLATLKEHGQATVQSGQLSQSEQSNQNEHGSQQPPFTEPLHDGLAKTQGRAE